MRKFREVRSKLLFFSLSLSVVIMVIVVVVFSFSLQQMNRNANEVYRDLTNQASLSSQEVVRDNAEQLLQEAASDRARLYEQHFAEIENAVRRHQAYIEYVWANPTRFPGHEVRHATLTEPDALAEKYVLAPGVERDANIEQELSLLSNLEYVFRPEFLMNDMILMLFAGTEAGVFYALSEFNVVTEGYDPRVRPWYKLAMEHPGEVVWTEPYDGAMVEEGTQMVTSATTFHTPEGEIIGVLAIDVKIEAIENQILPTEIGEEGHSFLLDRNGDLLFFEPVAMEAMQETEEWWYLREHMKLHENGFTEMEIGGQIKYVAYRFLPLLEWSLGIVIDSEEVLAGIYEMNAEMERITQTAMEDFYQMERTITLVSIALSGLLVLVAFLGSFYLSRKLTDPIHQLRTGAEKIGSGDFDHVIHVETHDEIKELADDFNQMTKRLKDYIKQHDDEVKANEKIANELQIAKDLQLDMLPKVEEDLAETLACMIQTTKDVGGDFYDFFYLDESKRRIAFIIADVSGKGIPAAWLMVVSKVLLKYDKSLPVNETLEAANKALAENNHNMMFVTAFVSILDLEAGEYTYANAGHNPPVFYERKQEKVSFLPLIKGPPLGVFPEKQYEAKTIQLEKGDTLLLYIDGLTEAFQPDGKMYGAKRVLEEMERLKKESPAEIVHQLYESVRTFTGDTEQSDDITMLCFRF